MLSVCEICGREEETGTEELLKESAAIPPSSHLIVCEDCIEDRHWEA
jgi:ribosome-binding protein aMBF1 (putative translation factor)